MLLHTNLIVHLRGTDITPAELGLWIILSEYRNAETGLCCPTQEDLATRWSMDVKTVRRILRKGHSMGLYEIVQEFNPETQRKFHRYEWASSLLPEPRGKSHLSEGGNSTLKPFTECTSRTSTDPQGLVGENSLSDAGDIPHMSEKRVNSMARIRDELIAEGSLNPDGSPKLPQRYSTAAEAT